jgi:putative transposase
VGDVVYHVLNRANARVPIFQTDADYQAFLKVFAEAHLRIPMRTLSYLVMPNHWHLVLWPRWDGDLSHFMHWLTTTHTQRWLTAHETVGFGHLYGGRFKSFPVEDNRYYLTVCRYVEGNALRAGLVSRAEDWRWSSLWQRTRAQVADMPPLVDGPLALPGDWLSVVNSDHSKDELDAIRQCVVRGRPFGTDEWTSQVAARLRLGSTLRPPGRPRT